MGQAASKCAGRPIPTVQPPGERAKGLACVPLQPRHPTWPRRSVTASVRLGVEIEPWPDRLKLRGGGYFEPSRFEGVAGRMHATAGLDVRLFEWDLFGLVPGTAWRLSLVGDVARRYVDWGIGIGFWH